MALNSPSALGLAGALLAMAGFGAPLSAQEADLQRRIEALEQNVERLEQQAAQTAKVSKSKLRVESADGRFAFQVGGRVFSDLALIDDDVTDVGDGAEFRAARLYITGKLYGDWAFKNQIDFAGNGVSLKDVYISYTGLQPVVVTLGNVKEPFSLEELTSSRFNSFMERALPNAFSPGRNLGVKITTGGAHASFGAGVFGDGIDSGGGVGNDSDLSVTGRATIAPLAEAGRVLHLGLSATYRSNNDGGTLTIAQSPEANQSVDFVDTGALSAVEDFWTVGPEFALVYQEVSLQAEYLLTRIKRGVDIAGTNQPDLSFDGWYVSASWFPTGESRNYVAKAGKFDRIMAQNAVELALRYSTINLNDANVAGGEERNWSFGFNYTFHPQVRAMLNYVHADIKGGIAGDEDVNIVQARFQIDF